MSLETDDIRRKIRSLEKLVLGAINELAEQIENESFQSVDCLQEQADNTDEAFVDFKRDVDQRLAAIEEKLGRLDQLNRRIVAIEEKLSDPVVPLVELRAFCEQCGEEILCYHRCHGVQAEQLARRCLRCKGTGFKLDQNHLDRVTCPSCHGTGSPDIDKSTVEDHTQGAKNCAALGAYLDGHASGKDPSEIREDVKKAKEHHDRLKAGKG